MDCRFGSAIPLPSALSSVTLPPVRPHVDPTPAAPALAALVGTEITAPRSRPVIPARIIETEPDQVRHPLFAHVAEPGRVGGWGSFDDLVGGASKAGHTRWIFAL
jgi:hypothetical protein